MEGSSRFTTFAKFAWFTLAYNILVILWGVFLRASKSGDGCGQHWLTCHGEVIPSAPELKTIIEFSHRLTTGPAFIFVLILLIWAFRRFEKGHPIRLTAALSFVFIITEVLVGAGLVLTGNTAEALTAARPFWAVGHLINTFALLAFLTLTAWHADGPRKRFANRSPKAVALIVVGAIAILLVGTSGSVAALGSMLFPSESLVEGISKDFSAASNILIRLRLSHPILSILTSVYLLFVAGWLKAQSAPDAKVARWSNILSIVVIVQVAFGAATLLTLAPIIMQVGHLLLADILWISSVLLAANFLSKPDVS
ncbi:MAG TPA: COX15/CtaA family protein [Pyrinomonadaceae bacterium]